MCSGQWWTWHFLQKHMPVLRWALLKIQTFLLLSTVGAFLGHSEWSAHSLSLESPSSKVVPLAALDYPRFPLEQGFSKFWQLRANLATQNLTEGHQRKNKLAGNAVSIPVVKKNIAPWTSGSEVKRGLNHETEVHPFKVMYTRIKTNKCNRI